MTDDTNPSLRVAAEMASERLSQTARWPVDHDDHHSDGSIAMAAALYAAPIPLFEAAASSHIIDRDPWPWKTADGHANDGDKRGEYDRRRQLVVAGALIIAEIERLDRAADELDLGGYAVVPSTMVDD